MARMAKCRPQFCLHAIGLIFLLVSSLTQQSAGEDGIIKKIKDFAEWLQGECVKFGKDKAAIKELDKSRMDLLNGHIWHEGGDGKKLSLFEANKTLIAESLESAETYLNEYRKTGVPKERKEENEEYKLLMNLTNMLKQLFLYRDQMEFFIRDENNAETSDMGAKQSSSANYKTDLYNLRVQVNEKVVELLKQIWFQGQADIVKKLSDQNSLDKIPIRKMFHDYIKQLDLAPYLELALEVVGQMKGKYEKLMESLSQKKDRIPLDERERRSKNYLQKLLDDLKRLFSGEYPTTFHMHLDKSEHILSTYDEVQLKSDFQLSLRKVAHFARDFLNKLESALEKRAQENRKYERYHANVLENSISKQMLNLITLVLEHHQNNNNNNNNNNLLELYHNLSLLNELAKKFMEPKFFELSKPSEVIIRDREYIEHRGDWSKFDSEENELIQSIKDCLLRKIYYEDLYDEARYEKWLPERLMLHTEDCNRKEKENLRFRVALNALRTLTLFGRMENYYFNIDEEMPLAKYSPFHGEYKQIRDDYDKMRAEAIEQMGGYGEKFSEYIFGELSKQSEGKMKEADKAGMKRKEFDGKDKGMKVGDKGKGKMEGSKVQDQLHIQQD